MEVRAITGIKNYPFTLSCLHEKFIEKNVNSKIYKDDLRVPNRNSVTFGDKRIRDLEPRIWNMLPAELKRKKSYRKFKTQINNWSGPKCKCSACIYI